MVSPSCGEIIIIGIEPGLVGIGEEMTDPVRSAGLHLTALLTGGRIREIPVFGADTRETRGAEENNIDVSGMR